MYKRKAVSFTLIQYLGCSHCSLSVVCLFHSFTYVEVYVDVQTYWLVGFSFTKMRSHYMSHSPTWLFHFA